MAARRVRQFDIPMARVAALLAISFVTSWAQSTGTQQGVPQVSPQKPTYGEGPLDEPPPRFSDAMRARRDEDRQKRLVSDSQRLLLLANLLKSEVASSGAETMTPEMLKQVDEIEHLAKSVKDKMRN
jgi:hypothetical protein